MSLSDLLVAATEALGAEHAQLAGRLQEAARELCAREAALQSEASRLQADRRQLDEDRERFQAECESGRQLGVQASDVIMLDVGGRHFHTTRRTLCAVPGSMLAAWFSGRHTIQTRPDGTVFIDRSPLLFEYVLDYLRTGGDHPLTPPDENAKERLRDEFQFYGLPWFEADKPSMLDFVGGDVQHIILGHEFEDGNPMQMYVGAGRLLTTLNGTLEEGVECAGILWGLATGQRICSWPMEDAVHGKVQEMILFGEDESAQEILGFYRKDDGVVTAVFYSCQDGSMIREQVLQGEFSEVKWMGANREASIALLRDESRVSAWSLDTGALLWERFRGTESFDWFGGLSCDTFLYNNYGDRGGLVVCNLSTGTELYRVATSKPWTPGDNDSVRLKGKQLCCIVKNGTAVFYESWDEKGVVLVPFTKMVCEGKGLHVVSDGCGDMIVTTTKTGVCIYPIVFPAPHTVAVGKGIVVRLGDGGGPFDDVELMRVAGRTIAVLSNSGEIDLFIVVHEEISRKRRKIGKRV